MFNLSSISSAPPGASVSNAAALNFMASQEGPESHKPLGKKIPEISDKFARTQTIQEQRSRRLSKQMIDDSKFEIPAHQKQRGKGYSMLKMIKNFDMFGKPIAFTYKGDEVYRSIWGGMVTVLVKFIFLLFFAVKFKRLARSDFSIAMHESMIDLDDMELEPLELMDHNFMFAVTKPPANKARVKVLQQRVTKDGVEDSSKEIPMVNCDTLFSRKTDDESPISTSFTGSNALASGDYLCPDTDSLVVSG